MKKMQVQKTPEEEEKEERQKLEKLMNNDLCQF